MAISQSTARGLVRVFLRHMDKPKAIALVSEIRDTVEGTTYFKDIASRIVRLLEEEPDQGLKVGTVQVDPSTGLMVTWTGSSWRRPETLTPFELDKVVRGENA